jgi:hypothetical protein
VAADPLTASVNGAARLTFPAAIVCNDREHAMTKKLILAIPLATAALIVAGPIFAGTPGLDHREHNQAQRIRQGVVSGELTRPETRRLVRGEARLHRNEALAKSDGIVTPRERARLQQEANVESARIHRQKHDAQDRN